MAAGMGSCSSIGNGFVFSPKQFINYFTENDRLEVAGGQTLEILGIEPIILEPRGSNIKREALPTDQKALLEYMLTQLTQVISKVAEVHFQGDETEFSDNSMQNCQFGILPSGSFGITSLYDFSINTQKGVIRTHLTELYRGMIAASISTFRLDCYQWCTIVGLSKEESMGINPQEAIPAEIFRSRLPEGVVMEPCKNAYVLKVTDFTDREENYRVCSLIGKNETVFEIKETYEFQSPEAFRQRIVLNNEIIVPPNIPLKVYAQNLQFLKKIWKENFEGSGLDFLHFVISRLLLRVFMTTTLPPSVNLEIEDEGNFIKFSSPEGFHLKAVYETLFVRFDEIEKTLINSGEKAFLLQANQKLNIKITSDEFKHLEKVRVSDNQEFLDEFFLRKPNNPFWIIDGFDKGLIQFLTFKDAENSDQYLLQISSPEPITLFVTTLRKER